MRSCRASGSVAGACVLRLVVVADRPGALALGSPWHLARLGTWHVIVATVLPWNLPVRLVVSLCVLAARARRACPAFLVRPSAWRLGTWLALALGTPWHLARDRRDCLCPRGSCLRVSSPRCVCSLRVLVVSEAWDGVRWDEMRCGIGWDGMGWDGMGWDGMGWDPFLAVADDTWCFSTPTVVPALPGCPMGRLVPEWPVHILSFVHCPQFVKLL